MRKRLIAIFCILSSVLLIFLALVLFEEKSSNSPVRLTNEKLVYGDGIVTNIWLDNISKLDILKEHNIKYLFIDVGGTGEDGRIETSKEEIKEFLNFLNLYEQKNNYDFILLPYSEINSYIYNLNSSFIENFIIDYADLVGMGFDGLLVDIEAVPFNKRDVYIELLEKLDILLPKDAIVSVYSGSLEDSQNEWEWGYAFYREVSERVDMISIPSYDLGLSSKEEYQDYVKEQIRRIASNNWSSYFLFAVPTHKEFPETIENALSVYKSELKKYPGNNFLGVCIFAEWTISDDEWNIFKTTIFHSSNDES